MMKSLTIMRWVCSTPSSERSTQCCVRNLAHHSNPSLPWRCSRAPWHASPQVGKVLAARHPPGKSDGTPDFLVWWGQGMGDCLGLYDALKMANGPPPPRRQGTRQHVWVLGTSFKGNPAQLVDIMEAPGAAAAISRAAVAARGRAESSDDENAPDGSSGDEEIIDEDIEGDNDDASSVHSVQDLFRGTPSALNYDTMSPEPLGALIEQKANELALMEGALLKRELGVDDGRGQEHPKSKRAKNNPAAPGEP